MEAERPTGYNEMISGDESWEALGMRIKWTKPEVPGESTIAMLDPLVLRLCVEFKKPLPLRDLTAWAWTCTFHKDNIEGIYREIPLIYDTDSRKWDDDGVTTYEFETTIYPTHNDLFRLTYNVKFWGNMVWADELQIDHLLTVTLPKDVNQWTKSAHTRRITDNLYIGNSLSVMLAEEMFFDAVLMLNTDSILDTGLNLNRVVKTSRNEILPIGGGSEISHEKIDTIVNWMRDASGEYNNVLVGDKEGQGRAGSSMTAYIFSNNPNLTFEEAYKLVLSRKLIYCHKGLRSTLYNMYPRD